MSKLQKWLTCLEPARAVKSTRQKLQADDGEDDDGEEN